MQMARRNRLTSFPPMLAGSTERAGSIATFRKVSGLMNTTPNLPPVHSRDKSGTALYEKVCAGCGAVSIVDRRRLACLCRTCSGAKKKTHGLTVGGKLHPLYRLLSGMVSRCTYPSAQNYKYYGGKGIKVHEEWVNDPSKFVAWAMEKGWKPGLEIDRLDSDRDYCPENCQLLPHRENSQKTSRIKTKPENVKAVRAALADGLSIKAAAEAGGVTYMVAWHIKNSPDVWSNIT